MSKLEHCPHCGCELADPNDHSDAARRRFFAIIKDAHDNLPSLMQSLTPSPEHLRKLALIKAGHCETRVTDCGTKRAAIEVSALAKSLDDYAVTQIDGQVVTVWTARSIRKRVCPKAVFLPLTERVYAWLNEFLGYDVEASDVGKAAA